VGLFGARPKRCTEGGPRHRFEPRYTQQPIGAGNDMATLWQAMDPTERPRIYVHDICVDCGKVVAPENKKP
jgi:hypothetical protein